MKIKTIKTLLISGLALVCSNNLFAEVHSYLSANGSVGIQTDFKFEGTTKDDFDDLKNKSIYGGNLAYGIACERARFEIELGYKKINTDDVGIVFTDSENMEVTKIEFTLDSYYTSLMINAFYDIPLSNCIDFYLGVGAGPALYSLDVSFTVNGDKGSGSTHTLVLGGQAMAGFNYRVNDSVDLFGGYRFFASMKPKTEDSWNFRFSDLPMLHCLDLGIRVYL